MSETLWTCKVKAFGPLIVCVDTYGRNRFKEKKVIFNERKDKALEEIHKEVSFIRSNLRDGIGAIGKRR